MSELTETEKSSLIQYLRTEQGTIDLLSICELLRIDYFGTFLPAVTADDELRLEISKFYQRVKFSLVQKIFLEATKGEKNRQKISLPSAKFIIDLINSGGIFAAEAAENKSDSGESIPDKEKSKSIADTRKRYGAELGLTGRPKIKQRPRRSDAK
jgi:hypothetical protein